MLDLIFGRPGSGKTEYITNKIKARIAGGKRTYLLVPEQEVYISERRLDDLPDKAGLCFEVISFSRMASLVFGRLGGLTYSDVSSGERTLLMWQALRETAGFLKEYSSVRADGRFSDMMLSVIDELSANGVTPELLEELSTRTGDPALSDKLSDIAVIYASYEKNIGERVGENASGTDDKLLRLAKTLSEHDFFSGSEIYVDSFTDFTAPEHAVLRMLMAQADKVCLTLCCEGRGMRNVHTSSVRDTLRRVTSYARNRGIEVKDVILGKNKRAGAELSALEKSLWDFSLTEKDLPEIPEDARGAISMALCKNEYEEAEYAALRICEERESGVDYSEIAVVMRDTESRRGIINAVFDKYNIPYFYSEKTDLSSTPVCRLTLSALRCISRNFRLGDVLALVKTGLCGVDPCDTDLFEFYCLTWNINGNRFFDERWSMNPDGYTIEKSRRGEEILSAANRVREQLIPPLRRLAFGLSEARGNAGEMCRAFCDYLDEISLSSRLCDLATFELSAGNVKDAGELLRVYDVLIEALTKIATLMGNTEISVEELASAVEILLSRTDIASVPAMSDYVTIGSAATLRVDNIKTAILIGMCEGEFPQSYKDDGILREKDKKELEELGLSLRSREESLISDELFYVYRAMTKPSKRLILTTVSCSADGRAKYPSSAYNRIKFLFPYIKEELFDLSRIKSLAALRKSSDNADAPLPDVDTVKLSLSDITPKDKLPSFSPDVSYEEIDPMTVKMLFGDRLRLTKSRISAFAECPYRFWCEYVLDLRENKGPSISYGDSGTLIHYILEQFLRRIKRPDGALEAIDHGSIVSLTDKLTEDYIGKISCPLSPSLMYSFSRLRDLSLVMIESIIEEFKSSEFRIAALERRISDDPSSLSPLEIRINDASDSPTVSLGGVVDRIDYYKNENGIYLRVVDYKTGSHSFDVSKLAEGTDLQLPAYLFAASSEQNKAAFGDLPTIPASALYLSADEDNGMITPVRSGFILDDSELLHAMSADMKKDILAGISVNKKGEPSGKALVDADGMLAIKELLQGTISEVARSIYSGKAQKHPTENGCKYCPVKQSCPSAIKGRKK